MYDDTDGIHPTRGQRLTFTQDFAGLGGDVRISSLARQRDEVQEHRRRLDCLGPRRRRLHHAAAGSAGPGRDAIRLTDRFFGPQLRGFDIRGIGPRIQRIPYNADGTLATDQARSQSTRSAAGPITWAGSSLNSRQLGRCAAWAQTVGIRRCRLAVGHHPRRS